jgi:hypothetical protein
MWKGWDVVSAHPEQLSHAIVTAKEMTAGYEIHPARR